MPNFGDLFGGSNIKSIQRGVIAVSQPNDTVTVAITRVNPAFTELRMLGVTRSNYTSLDDVEFGGGYVTLTDGGASVTAKSALLANGGLANYLSWELTEYYPS